MFDRVSVDTRYLWYSRHGPLSSVKDSETHERQRNSSRETKRAFAEENASALPNAVQQIEKCQRTTLRRGISIKSIFDATDGHI